jgi:hypothetical protein
MFSRPRLWQLSSYDRFRDAPFSYTGEARDEKRAAWARRRTLPERAVIWL